MTVRAATADDLPGILALYERWDTAWFGAPEHDADEVAEELARVGDRSTDTRLHVWDDRVVAAAWRWTTSATVLIDPQIDEHEPVHADLLGWLAAGRPVEVEAFHRDDALQAALTARGWTRVRSSFELLRPVTADWVLPRPRWDAGVELRPYDPADARTLHRLIYVDAAYAAVPGHPDRDFDDWFALFMAAPTRSQPPVLAYRADRLIGVGLGRIFSDGTGWIAQLAVARDERGRGTGSAIVHELLARLVAAGATALGLGVEADNRGALQIYLDAGLRIEREWLTFAPPATR